MTSAKTELEGFVAEVVDRYGRDRRNLLQVLRTVPFYNFYFSHRKFIDFYSVFATPLLTFLFNSIYQSDNSIVT